MELEWSPRSRHNSRQPNNKGTGATPRQEQDNEGNVRAARVHGSPESAGEENVDVSRIRVSPEVLTSAIARIERRKEEERQYLESTIALGDAVTQLELGITPEELLQEIEACETVQPGLLAEESIEGQTYGGTTLSVAEKLRDSNTYLGLVLMVSILFNICLTMELSSGRAPEMRLFHRIRRR